MMSSLFLRNECSTRATITHIQHVAVMFGSVCDTCPHHVLCMHAEQGKQAYASQYIENNTTRSSLDDGNALLQNRKGSPETKSTELFSA